MLIYHDSEIVDPGRIIKKLDANGINYTPDFGYEGADSFTYTISDGVATATATVSGQRAGSLGIAAFQLGMEGRQRRAHELRDLALCRDAMGIERAREPRLPGRQQLMYVADVLYLKRRRRSRRRRPRGLRAGDRDPR